MATKYYMNGRLDDEFGTGVSIEIRDDGVDSIAKTEFISGGKANLGYLAKEISAEEAKVWIERIANPDMINYFPGIFKKIGVVNKTVYEKLQAERNARKIANLSVARVSALITLAKHGVTKEMIYAKIAEMPNDQAVIAKIWFDEALRFNRSNEYIKQIGTMLSMTESQLDELFIEASSVS